MMKKAIVVGASSGIGREVALALLAEGWKVGLMARRESAMQELAQAYPGKVEVMVCDITMQNAPQQLLQLVDKMGGVYLYVHAAGIGKAGEVLDVTVEMQTLQTNVMAFANLIDTIYVYMASHHGGHIVAISSIAGTKGMGIAPSYSASKGFQQLYLQALEQKSRANGDHIFVTDIRPGFVDTALIAGRAYPMKMEASKVAHGILKAIEQRKSSVVIDWRYRCLVGLWRCLPNALWRRMAVGWLRKK